MGRTPKITIEKIMRAAARVCGVPDEHVLGHVRAQQAVDARHIGIFVARERFGWKVTQIATVLTVDHSSVSYGKDRITLLLYRDPYVAELVDRVTKVAESHLPAPVALPVPREKTNGPRGSTIPKPVRAPVATTFMPSTEQAEEIRKLRKLGFSVRRIHERTNIPEMVVARICGVPMWAGVDTREIRKQA